jgi:hypothetical protein
VDIAVTAEGLLGCRWIVNSRHLRARIGVQGSGERGLVAHREVMPDSETVRGWIRRNEAARVEDRRRDAKRDLTLGLLRRCAGPPAGRRERARRHDRVGLVVCHGRLALATAQRTMARDWVAAYRKYVGPVPTS